MCQSGSFRSRKAVGSIIGGAFILLIILAGYEFYIMNNRAQNNYQLVLNDMRNFDIDKNQEDLKVPYIETQGAIVTNEDTVSFNGDGSLTLHIRNDGPQLVNISYAGLLIGGDIPENTECYQETSLQITPSQVEELEIFVVNEHVSNTTAQIQIITDRGNTFPIEYPQSQEDYPYAYILSGAISKVIGRVLPEYDSFRWGLMENANRTLPSMISSWVVVYDNQDNHVFSVTVNHYGNDQLTLSNKTGLYFECLNGPRELVECFIVDYNTTDNKIYKYDDIILPAFDPENQDEPQPVTLFFATDREGRDPLSDPFPARTLNVPYRYQVKIGIYDKYEIYAQAFSLIAIEVT